MQEAAGELFPIAQPRLLAKGDTSIHVPDSSHRNVPIGVETMVDHRDQAIAQNRLEH